jgi:hypothetical protein
MKTRNKLLIAVVSLITLCAWTSMNKHDIKQAEWLIGTWENKTPKGSIYETWTNNGKGLSGKSYLIKENDTIVFETIQLIQEGDKSFYIPTVKNQNDGLPVRFISTMVSETQLVFENPQHDYPQIISYTKVEPDSLVAEISGPKNGQVHKQKFPMKKIK